jgi:hypothetical protein
MLRSTFKLQHDYTPRDATGWHIDNDYFRHFLDSSSNALTIINCFTNIKPQGGGTFVAEEGIADIAQFLYEHPEGLDPPFGYLFRNCRNMKKYATVGRDCLIAYDTTSLTI